MNNVKRICFWYTIINRATFINGSTYRSGIMKLTVIIFGAVLDK